MKKLGDLENLMTSVERAYRESSEKRGLYIDTVDRDWDAALKQPEHAQLAQYKLVDEPELMMPAELSASQFVLYHFSVALLAAAHVQFSSPVSLLDSQPLTLFIAHRLPLNPHQHTAFRHSWYSTFSSLF